jgi:hypothetical protein
MSLLQDEAGLIALLVGAVLMGIAVIVAASLLHSRQEPTSSRGDGPQVDPVSDGPGIVSRVAATAPTDAHMSLGVVVEALRRRLRRLAGL